MGRGAWQGTLHRVTESDVTEQLKHSTPYDLYFIHEKIRIRKVKFNLSKVTDLVNIRIGTEIQI